MMIERQFAQVRKAIVGLRHYFVMLRDHRLFDMSTGRIR